ncbi:MAG: hypothetical protein ACR2QC_03550 [Gammaproteobacteria bacterium]
MSSKRNRRTTLIMVSARKMGIIKSDIITIAAADAFLRAAAASGRGVF